MAAALRTAALERSFLYLCLMREPLVWRREEGERQELEDQQGQEKTSGSVRVLSTEVMEGQHSGDS